MTKKSSTRRTARMRSMTGPRAKSAPIRRLGAAGRGTVQPELLERLRKLPGVQQVTAEPRGLSDLVTVQAVPADSNHRSVMSALGDAPIGKVTAREPTLEDAHAIGGGDT